MVVNVSYVFYPIIFWAALDKQYHHIHALFIPDHADVLERVRNSGIDRDRAYRLSRRGARTSDPFKLI